VDGITPKDRFLQSLERCAADEQFIPAFYDRFLGSSIEVRSKFRQTDFSKQHAMLLRSLRLAAGAVEGDHDALVELAARTETHDRQHLNIPPRLYQFWLDAALTTAAQFDPEWDHPTAVAWDRILGYLVEHMTRHY
jgi:hemoglobin-like flavoprotein